MSKILIVDDRAINRQHLVSLLGKSGYHTLEAVNGHKALEILRIEKLDLVITDILMPLMDGYELARQVRGDPAIADMPIIFFSATYNDEEAKALAKAAGVAYVLTKSAEPQSILDAVAIALKRLPGSVFTPVETKPLIDPIHIMASKMAEKMGQLDSLSRRLAGLVELSLRVTLERDPGRMLQMVCDQAREIIGARYAAIGLLAEDGKTLKHFITSGMDAEIVRQIEEFPTGRGLLGKMLQENRTLRLAKISGHPDSVGFPKGHPHMRSFLGAPIAAPAVIYGRLYLTEKIGSEEFSEEDEELAVTLAAQVAVAYENMHLYNEIQHHAVRLQLEMNERKKTQAELEESERRFRALVEHSTDAIAVNALDGTVLYVSPAVESITGIHARVGEVVSPFERIHPDDVELCQRNLDRILKEPLTSGVVRFRILHPDGTWRWLEVISTNLLGEPGVGGIVSNFSDITERQHAEEIIESLANFPDESSSPVLRFGRDGFLQYANAASQTLLKAWGCEVGNQPPDEIWLHISLSLVSRSNQQIEVIHGDRVDELLFVPIIDKDYVNVYGRDITERKTAEAALRKSEERFSKAFHSSPAGINITRASDGVFLAATDSFLHLVGFTREEVLGRTAFALCLFPEPEAISRVREILLKQGIVRNHELNLRTKLGELRAVLFSTEVIQLEAEAHYLTTIIDITNRKQAEEALRESVTRSRAIANAVPDLVFRLGRGVFLDYKAAKEDLFIQSESIIGSRYRDLFPLEFADFIEQHFCSTLESGQLQEFEYQLPIPGKGLRNYEARMIPSGEAEVVVFSRDITERKQVQAQILRRNRLYATLSQINRIIALASEPGLLFEDICRAAIDDGHYRLAWIGLIEESTAQVRPVAFAGEERDYLSQIQIKSADEPLGRGPTGTAIRENRCVICQDIATDPKMEPWRAAALERGYLSSASIPFRQRGKTVGSFMVYASEPNAFDISDETLLKETSSGISFALDSMQSANERQRAEDQIQRQLEQLNALRTIDIAISSSFDLQITLDVVLQQVLSQLGVDAAAILLLSPDLHKINYAADRGFQADAFHHPNLKLGDSYAGQAVLTRRTIHIPDLMQTKVKLSNARLIAHEKFVDYYGAPLIVKGEVKGVLEIYHRSYLKADNKWLEFLEMLAGQAAIAIDNARLFEDLQQLNSILEQRVVERTAELNHTNAELERANRVKDEFLANMSHELRTPLTSILGLSESLMEQKRGSLNDLQLRSLEIIESSGRHLLDLINDILDLSKIEAGKFDYFPQPIGIDEICRSSLAFVKALAAKKSISLGYTNEAQVSEINADPRRFKQILVNLLTNAVKFTPQHGDVTLHVSCNLEQELISFSVVDTGMGISVEDLKRLFQPFVQVDSGLNRQQNGTGLGLALVQRLTDLHGGSVEVESEVGKGSRFTVNLSCKGISYDRASSPHLHQSDGIVNEKTAVTVPVPASHGLVLLAEDNEANILTIGEYLRSDGFEVAVAHDGLEAIQQAERVDPDVILMDIQMPVLDGLQAIARLRTNSRFASTPVIALTALAMPGDRNRCLAAGANEYLSKPVGLRQLVTTIQELLSQREQRTRP